ncbi:hypothetical protein [Leptospira santarosai]|uniref:hypothetical protein n=1 Tax=Leptospira santarosai TaxID=28183 RepID=UPI000313013C|nr:hypothetical protein [Leptospira santarosai]
MITRLSILLILFASFFSNVLFADTVKNNKTNEVIENVKTSENDQGVIVEYEDGTKRGFTHPYKNKYLNASLLPIGIKTARIRFQFS